MNVGKWWFRPSGEGWHPGLYDWFFGSTRRGALIRAREEEIIYDFLQSVLRPDHTVLELGPGTGHYTVPLARRCARVVGVEPSEPMRRSLQQRLDREGLTNVENRSGYLEDPIETTETFDGVLAIGPLYYVQDLAQGLQALTAALKAGGWSIFAVPLPTVEGWLQVLSDLAARRRIYLRSPEETVELAERIGLKVERYDTVGTSRRGFSLLVQAHRS